MCWTYGRHRPTQISEIQTHISHCPSYHELALDVGISDSLAAILHQTASRVKNALASTSQKDYTLYDASYAFHQTDVARGVLHEERLHTPAAANAARRLAFRLGVPHHA
jgi:hypothetical protein